MMQLIITWPDGTTERRSVDRTFGMGRARQNDLVIDDARVSRHHFLVHAERDGGCTLVDLGSANGTYLNGRRLVLPARLEDGDVIEVGAVSFTCVDESPATPRDRTAGDDTTAIDLRTRDVTVLVADVRGYSALAELLPAAELSQLIGRWFRLAGDVVDRHGGAIDKFMGDGFMAVWTAPREGEAPPIAPAVEAAMALTDASRTLDADGDRTLGAGQFRVGISIHAGPALVGNVGIVASRDYSVMGDTVNTAFRIEPMTKRFPYPILTSDAVASQVPNYPFASLGPVTLAGKSHPIALYGLAADSVPAQPDAPPKMQDAANVPRRSPPE